MKKIITTLAVASVVAALGVTAVVYFGLINVGADDRHSAPILAFLEIARDRSVEVRAQDIEIPDLNDEAQIRAGAGNYDSMCVGCHLAPEAAETELSEGLYPAPPNLAEAEPHESPAKMFWIIKHGIKATGMPAWGKSMEDQYIWGMVAFLKQLPTLDAGQYRALVSASGGHQHGGGETDVGNHHGDNQPEGGEDHHGGSSSDHHGAADPVEQAGNDAHANGTSENQGKADHHGSEIAHESEAPAATPTSHKHADGKEHLHED